MYHNLFRAPLLYAVIVIILTACGAPAPTQAPSPTLISPTATSILPTPTQTLTLSVASTLDGLTALPHRIQWEAKPSVPENQVSKVDFLIDGQIAFVEEHAPYMYGRDGGYLVTSFLALGEHSFTVRVNTVDGQSVESTVKAMIAAAPTPPDGLANTSWTREMTASDRQKATSPEGPPSGRWGITIDSVGWMFHDPEGGGQLWDVAYNSAGNIELRATIEQPPYPYDFGGSICEEPDPPFIWTYTFGDGGKTLTLHPVGQDLCGDRVAILEGTWTREGN